MRRKLIIVSTVLVMVFCLSLLAYNVYASLNQVFTISNTIGFVASQDLYVALDCSVSGAQQTDINNVPAGFESLEQYFTVMQFKKEIKFNESDRGSKQQLEDWMVGDKDGYSRESLLFKDEKTPIIYSIKVYNYSELKIKISISGTAQNNKLDNEISSKNGVEIDGYKFNGDPSFATITLTTSIKSGVDGFKDIDNSFKLIIEPA